MDRRDLLKGAVVGAASAAAATVAAPVLAAKHEKVIKINMVSTCLKISQVQEQALNVLLKASQI